MTNLENLEIIFDMRSCNIFTYLRLFEVSINALVCDWLRDLKMCFFYQMFFFVSFPCLRVLCI